MLAPALLFQVIAVPREADTFLTVRSAWLYLRERVGDAVPTYSSFKAYNKPSWRASGRTPPGLPAPVRVPGRAWWLFRRSDLDDWIAAVRREADAQVAARG